VRTVAGRTLPEHKSQRDKLIAAIFNTWRTRLNERLVLLDSTLPPLILVPGLNPSHELKCLAIWLMILSLRKACSATLALYSGVCTLRVFVSLMISGLPGGEDNLNFCPKTGVHFGFSHAA
jgi:hypothetical protein